MPYSACGNDKVDILGVRVRRTTLSQTLDLAEAYLHQEGPRYAVFINVYNVIEARRDPEYCRALNEADLPMPDGMPLVWASQLFRQPVGSRVCGPDFLDSFNARAAQKGYSCFFMAGGDKKAERTAAAFQARYPGLRVVGTWTPPLGPIEGELNEYILHKIAQVQPDILWVGLGAPLQERWVWKNKKRLQARLTLAVGGAFDYHIGLRRRAPRWMQKSGLEFWYRVSQDPRLIWTKRHYADLHEFVLPVLVQAITGRYSTTLNQTA